MTNTWVTVLILSSFFNGRPEVKQLSGVSEIVIHRCVAVILGVSRKILEVLIVFFWYKLGFYKKFYYFFDCLFSAWIISSWWFRSLKSGCGF
jgi:hypothetical protein